MRISMSIPLHKKRLGKAYDTKTNSIGLSALIRTKTTLSNVHALYIWGQLINTTRVNQSKAWWHQSVPMFQPPPYQALHVGRRRSRAVLTELEGRWGSSTSCRLPQLHPSSTSSSSSSPTSH